MTQRRAARWALWLTALSVLAVQLAFFPLAPCSVFDGWSLPSIFYEIIWPLLTPAILVLAWATDHSMARGAIPWWHWLAWALILAAICWGWYDGYLRAVIAWWTTPGMPWPGSC